MSKTRNKRRVFRLYLPWNLEKETVWLNQMSRSGWHLIRQSGLFYHFELGDPRNYVYRQDYQITSRLDRPEYLRIFRDAGWEHIAEIRGCHYFRTEAQGAEWPEIFSDQQSKIDMYGRVLSIMLVLFLPIFILIFTVAPHRYPPRRTDWIQDLYDWGRMTRVFLLAIFVPVYGYFFLRLLLLIGRLKKGLHQ
jgi:hypothetical protein